MEKTELEKAIEDEILNPVTRLLVLLECEGGFRQVVLTHDQFKKVGDIVAINRRIEDGKEHADFCLRLDMLIPSELFGDMEDYDKE